MSGRSCKELVRVDGEETRGQGDKEMGRHGDTETRRQRDEGQADKGIMQGGEVGHDISCPYDWAAHAARRTFVVA